MTDGVASRDGRASVRRAYRKTGRSLLKDGIAGYSTESMRSLVAQTSQLLDLSFRPDLQRLRPHDGASAALRRHVR